MRKFIAIVLTTLFATGAFAHSGLNTTVPANNAVLTEIPAQIGLRFANKIRLTKVEMTFQDQPAVTLPLGDQTSFARAFTLQLPEMGNGTYQIEWRGLGIDGHAMQGEYMFKVE